MDDAPKSPTGSQSAELTCYVDFVGQCTVTWFDIDEVGLPPQEHDEFYGDRYSCPVHIANAHTGQMEPHTVVYDYEDGGWCLYGLPDGPSCHDYELMLPTHYCLLPGFAV